MLLSSRPLLDTRADLPYFVGRGAEVGTALAAVDAGFNTIVLGARGSGRTSLLRRIALELRDRRQHRVEFVDGALVPTPQGLLELVAERLVGPRLERVYDATDRSPASLVTRWAGRYEPRPSSAGLLHATLDRLRADLDVDEEPPTDAHGPAWEQGSPVVVLLDGPSPLAAQTLFGRLRDDLWTLPVLWVVAGDLEHRGTLLKPPADAFFDQQVVLRPLAPADRERLVRRRLDLADDAEVDLATLVEQAETPRALVALARRHAEQRHEAQADVESRRRRRDEAQRRLAELGRPAAMLVAEVEARGGAASASDQRVLEALGWSRPRAVQVFRQLEEAGLVTVSTDKGAGAGRPRKVFHLVEDLR